MNHKKRVEDVIAAVARSPMIIGIQEQNPGHRWVALPSSEEGCFLIVKEQPSRDALGAASWRQTESHSVSKAFSSDTPDRSMAIMAHCAIREDERKIEPQGDVVESDSHENESPAV